MNKNYWKITSIRYVRFIFFHLTVRAKKFIKPVQHQTGSIIISSLEKIKIIALNQYTE